MIKVKTESMQRELLKEEEIESIIKSLPQWEVKEGKLYRVFEFKSFIEAFKFKRFQNIVTLHLKTIKIIGY